MTEYTFWKSTYTGTVYKMPGNDVPDPELKGWEPVHEDTYIKYCQEHNFSY